MAPPRLVAALLVVVAPAFAQPPKCPPRSLDSSCDAIAGSWTGIAGSLEPFFDEYAVSFLPAPAPPGTFTCYIVHSSAPWSAPWTNCTGQLSLDNTTASIAFNTGIKHTGRVAPGCQSILWSDGSSWQRYVRGPSPLRVHFALHTHDDVGWNKNLQQYFDGSGPHEYGQNVTAILDTVIPALAANAARRFSYVEQAYFSMWWVLQPPATQALVQRLVAARQLVFLNGGFSMHDEASPTYVDM